MDAQQELFTAIKLGLEGLGYAVYDGFLPPEGTPYPFVYLGDFRQNDREHKTGVIGTVHPMIHVWHNAPRQRGTVSAMLADIKGLFRGLERTGGYSWLVRNVTARIIPDNTTNAPLLHGIVEADFLYS